MSEADAVALYTTSSPLPPLEYRSITEQNREVEVARPEQSRTAPTLGAVGSELPTAARRPSAERDLAYLV